MLLGYVQSNSIKVHQIPRLIASGVIDQCFFSFTINPFFVALCRFHASMR